MSPKDVLFALRSGKNPKFAYYASAWLSLHRPAALLRALLPHKLAALERREDKEYILRRVDYYNRLTSDQPIDAALWGRQSVQLKDQPMTPSKVYYLDAMAYARYFPPSRRWLLLSGDINFFPRLPAVLKSRPIGSDSDESRNAVVLKLNKVRHFIFVRDRLSWSEKRDQVVFRNRITSGMGIHMSEHTRALLQQLSTAPASAPEAADISPRLRFMLKYFGHPLVDAGAIDSNLDGHPLWNPAWRCEKMTIAQQLRYKFVMAIEGNDVASNLKWVMSSNSIAVCPKPRFETWFMEGQLKADYHYIEVAPDFSDLPDKLRYYLAHPAAAEAIIRHAHEWVDQFRDSRRESLISLLVLDKYFRLTPQD